MVSIFHKKTNSPRMSRWIFEMREYNFEMTYAKGKENVVADKLSRPVLRNQVIDNREAKTFLGFSKDYSSESQRKQHK